MPFQEVNGFRMHYEEQGQGEVLLLQHGWLSTLHVWDAVIPHLQYRYRCIAVDARGCGESERTKEGHTMRQYADDVLALAQALGIERFTLIGHSMGGVIATYAALAAPQAVERLVYVSSTPSADLVDAGLMASMVAAGEPIAAGDRAVATGFMRSIWFNPDPEMLAATVDRALANSPEFTRESIRSVAEAHNNDVLASIKAPALAVTGAADPFLPAAIATMERLPNATLHVFAGVCHMPNAEAPAELATVIDNFVQRGVITAETVAAAAAS
jgi:pimeloyl-ACP methyl ester carboxylesterase